MVRIMVHSILILLLMSCFSLRLSLATDTITISKSINDSESLVSNNGIFRFGFFTPLNSSGRYAGIWYNNIPLTTVVWVANSDNPLIGSSGLISISPDGNLLVLDGQTRRILWSTNVSVSSAANGTSARLLDTGNLVVEENNNNRETVWESFQYPSDTFLPTMFIRTNSRTGEKIELTSWKSPSDPSKGSYTTGIDPLEIPEFFIWNNNLPFWRSGPWNGQVFLGVPNMGSLVFLDGFRFENDDNGTASMTYSDNSYLYRFSLDSEGKISRKEWDTVNGQWNTIFSFPATDCDVYGYCGEFGRCNRRKNPICSCIGGFEPVNHKEWNKGNWSDGCVRQTPLKCREDEFVRLQNIKVPDFAQRSSATEEECESRCLSNCSCLAYAFDRGLGCMLWNRSLIDIDEFSSGGLDLYVRVAASKAVRMTNRRIRIIVPAIIVPVIIVICMILGWRTLVKHREMKKNNSKMPRFRRNDVCYDDNGSRTNINQVEIKELPMFDFEVLATATNDFDIRKKLGQGGFGPVYKGELADGQEIAVKRLSRSSGQGFEEFMNEVSLISKLQHRNLVRLLGCCIEGDEKMLVYEFMPNNSLDVFIFDPRKRELLDWSKRINIIEGICRGLVYLHRDSRLKIIHRDLKASNILLDEQLNPRISDFGMAKIFGGDEDHNNTKRVVGTYGYMSPEYAMEGFFSEKSDAFSFGVLLLEIISGRRNSSFCNDELSLLGYAWKLWKEDDMSSLIDPIISNESFAEEVRRCVQIGLLCVQELACDRPSVSTVIWMLSSDNVKLPTPKQPAFSVRSTDVTGKSSEESRIVISINDQTFTTVMGR